MTIKNLVKKSFLNAKNKGFWEDYEYASCAEVDFEYEFDLNKYFLATKLALIHSEVTEALEDLRTNNFTRFGEELADIMIRTADLAGALGIDLEARIEQKMLANKKRPAKHGKQF